MGIRDFAASHTAWHWNKEMRSELRVLPSAVLPFRTCRKVGLKKMISTGGFTTTLEPIRQ
jgi:phosphoserine phosphatase